MERTEQAPADITLLLIIRLLTPRYATQKFGSIIVNLLCPTKRSRDRGPEESTFGSRFGSTTYTLETLNVRKTED